jgi:hypothetical protein
MPKGQFTLEFFLIFIEPNNLPLTRRINWCVVVVERCWMWLWISARAPHRMVTGSGLSFQTRLFFTLKPDTEILYKCSDYYAPECDGAIRFDDPDIGLDWGISSDQAILSEKDATALSLRDFYSPFIYEAAK